MGHPQSIWVHKKRHGKRKYSGHYRRVDGEREFILIATLKNGKHHVVTCESSNMAENDGWRLLNPRKRKSVRKKTKQNVRRKK